MHRAALVRSLSFGMLLAAGAAAAQDQGLAVAVRSFSGSGSAEIEAFARGYVALLSSDMTNVSGPCPLRVVEWERRADARREIQLGQSRHAQKGTFAQPGHATQPDVFVDGTLVERGQRMAWNVKVTDAVSGRVVAEERGSVPVGQTVDSSETVARNLANKLCQVKAGWRLSGRLDEASITGVVCGSLDRPFTATAPEVAGRWQFTPAAAGGGKFSYVAADVGGTRGTGAGTYRVQGDPSAGTAVAIHIVGTGSIQSPLGTFSGPINETLTLTPIPSCERVGDR